MNNEDLIKKYLDESISEEELNILKSSGDLEFLEKLDRELEDFRAPAFDTSQSYQDIKKDRRVIRMIPNKYADLYRVAAALVAGLFIAAIIFIGYEDQVTLSYADQSEILLPDSSLVLLNKESEISFNEEDFLKERTLQLTGQAFFKVRKGSAFTVVTTSGEVQVLGTSFDVQDRTGIFQVKCFEGRVRVVSNNDSEILTPNTQYKRLAETGVEVSTFDAAELPSWKAGKSTFESTPFIVVVRELARQYDVKVKIRKFDDKKLFTGGFTHSDLEVALKSITIPFDLSFKLEGDQVILSGE